MINGKNNSYINDIKARLIGIPLIALFIVIFVNTKRNCFVPEFWVDFFVTGIFTFIMWHGNRWISFYSHKKFPDLNYTFKRIALLVSGVVVFCIVSSIVLDAFFRKIIFKLPLSLEDTILNIQISLCISLFVMAIYESVFFFMKWKEAMMKTEELKKANLQNRFDALKTQVSPHFLFNSLNSLTSLIEEDQKKAISFVQELSQVYRYLLQSNEKHLTTLEDELSFIKAYLFLLQTRFGNNLIINIDVHEKVMQKKLPPLTLQLLIENAVKHNVISSAKPLTISIRSEKDELAIMNNLQEKTQIIPSGGFGLKNIELQYEQMYTKNISIEKTEFTFTVRIPLINT